MRDQERRGWRVKSETENGREAAAGAAAAAEEEEEEEDDEDEEKGIEEEEGGGEEEKGSGTKRYARKGVFHVRDSPARESRDSKKWRPAEKRLDSNLRPAANEGMGSLSLFYSCLGFVLLSPAPNLLSIPRKERRFQTKGPDRAGFTAFPRIRRKWGFDKSPS